MPPAELRSKLRSADLQVRTSSLAFSLLLLNSHNRAIVIPNPVASAAASSQM